jgi:hypothetical protein
MQELPFKRERRSSWSYLLRRSAFCLGQRSSMGSSWLERGWISGTTDVADKKA